MTQLNGNLAWVHTGNPVSCRDTNRCLSRDHLRLVPFAEISTIKSMIEETN